MAEPLPHEDQSPASGFQIEQEGTELMTLVLGAIQPDDLAAPYVDEDTPGADGLLTAADKLKLDDIEDAATADQTAVEIVALIDADATAEAALKTALELGSAAYTASTEYANSSQGDLADTAVQFTDLAEPYVDETDLGTDGLMSAIDKATLDVAAEQAETALQPPAVSALAIVEGAISTPLDGNHRTLQLTEDVDAGWTAPLPSGGDAATQVYWSSLDILPPASGGPFALSIHGDWVQTGPLDTIALEAGDDPITVVLRTWGASEIAYCAGWATL